MLSMSRLLRWEAHASRCSAFTLFLMLSTAASAQTYTFEREWGIGGFGGEEFAVPDGVAVDDSGAVYVTDVTQDRVMKFDADGAYIWVWRGAIDSDGLLLTAELDSDGFPTQFDADGIPLGSDAAAELLEKFNLLDTDSEDAEDLLENFDSLDTDEDGFLSLIEARVQIPGLTESFFNLMNSDSTDLLSQAELMMFERPDGFLSLTEAQVLFPGSRFVEIFDLIDGNEDGLLSQAELTMFTLFLNPTGFLNPQGVGVEGTDVYIADTGRSRIQKFVPGGIHLVTPEPFPGSFTIWGSFGAALTQFDNPVDIEVDDSGGVYVVDRNNHRIQKFSPFGVFLTRWGANDGDGSSGTGLGEFDSPEGIAVDPDFNTPGKGGVYVLDTENNRVQKFDSTGAFITSWGTAGSGDGQFSSPEGIAVDEDGNTFVADTGNDRIQKFDSDGVFITSWGSFGAATGQFDTPKDVAVNSSGDVYVSDSGNFRMQKFNPPVEDGDPTDPGVEAAADLLENFDLLDTDEDGFLSLTEAQVLFPGLTQSSFDLMDGNEDGLLSQAELTFVEDTATSSSGGGGGGGGGSCFIATAAYGTPMAQEIDTLRAVRDTYMLNNFVGSAFVDTYYRLSPVVADKVAENPALASLVRALLTPVVLLSGIFLAAPSSAWIAFVALFSMVVYMRQHRKSRRYSK